MSEFKWYNDDFQNNSSNQNNSQGFYSTYEEQKPPKKKKINFSNKKKVFTVALSVFLAVVITASGYSLVANNTSGMSDDLKNNLS